MNRTLFGLGVASIALATVVQERAIASTFSIRQTEARSVAQSSNPKLTGGPWSGKWKGNDGSVFSFTMQLSADSSNRVTGKIQWKMLAGSNSSHRSKIGLTATEYVNGTYNPKTRSVELQGQSADDPNSVISLDVYKISFDLSMQSLSGKTRNHGNWKGEIAGVADGPIALAGVVQKGKIAGDDACSRAVMEPPSTESKRINVSDSNFSFAIPQDFKAKTEDFGGKSTLAIVVSSPRDLAFLDCAQRNRMVGAGHGTEPIVIQILPMDDMMLAPDRTGGEYERKTIKVAGTAGILARSRIPEGYPSPGDEIIKVVFANQQKYHVQILMNTSDRKARKYNEAVFNQIVSSFSFSDQPQTADTQAGQNSPTYQSPQSIENLPDGQYFYGETNNLSQLGAAFVIFKKKNGLLIGQQYTSNTGGSSCFVGKVKAGNVLSNATLGSVELGPGGTWEFVEKASLDLGRSNNRDSLKYNLGFKQRPEFAKNAIQYCERGLSVQIASLLRAQAADNRSELLPGEAETIQKFKATIKDFETSNRSIYVRDKRSNQEKSEIASFVSGWSKQDSKLAKFLGSWGGYEDQILIYPSVKSGKVCILTTNETGTVLIGTGQSKGNRVLWTAPSFSFRGRSYPSRQSLLVREQRYLGAFSIEDQRVKSNQSFDFPYSSPRPLMSLNKVLENTESDRGAIAQKFENEGCTTALPGRERAHPVKPLTPIAGTNTYAYPSPAEFAQFKQTLKQSPVALSTTDRKLRQDFQAEWKKKNPSIGSYVGAWKTADNQDIYVFPSQQAGRACVIEKKDGKFESAIGVSLKMDMRYALSHGLFRVDGMSDVVAGRSDKSQPLSAFYASIGSPELPQGTKDELDRAKCVAELPKGGAIAAKKDPVPKPIDKSPSSDEQNPSNADSVNTPSIADDTTLNLAANNENGVQFTNSLPKKVKLNIKAFGSPSIEYWAHDASKALYTADGMTAKDWRGNQEWATKEFRLQDFRKGSLLVKRVAPNKVEYYQHIGSEGQITVYAGEKITFIMNDVPHYYDDNRGEANIRIQVREPNPIISIKLSKLNDNDFTKEQWEAFEIAARNWEKIIIHDKSITGKLKILVTKDAEDLIVGGANLKDARARVLEIDNFIGERQNFSGSAVDQNGQDFDNRMRFNEKWLRGGDAKQKSVLIAVAMHEIGHALGLYHPDIDPDKDKDKSLMEAADVRLGNFTIIPKHPHNGEDSITETMIKRLEYLGYSINRNAITSLQWE